MKYLAIQKTVNPPDRILDYNEMTDYIHSEVKKISFHLVDVEKKYLESLNAWKLKYNKSQIDRA